ncbi:MAG: hypothetical protein QOK05_2449 [Chloroflexota bacterium]|jgi:hypothetical protein|nr:hypothetical protein [Chloroflexota bacterium]
MSRRIRLRLLALIVAMLSPATALVANPPASAATFAPGGAVEIRDVEAARLQLVPPAPTALHPEVIQPDTQIEPSIAIDPANSRHVVAGFQEGRVDGGGDMTNGFATSFDAGQTWTYGEVPCLTYTVHTDPRCPTGGAFDRASDAVIAFGPDNTVYYNSLIFNDETGQALRSAITVNVSKDGGLTWSLPVTFQDDNIGGLNDKNWIVVDNSDAAGHHKGRVYVVWDRVAPVVYNYCDADCDVLTNWVPTMLPINGLQGIGAQPMVLNDGSLGVMYTTQAGSPLSLPGEQPEFSPGTTQIVFALAPLAGTTPWPSPLLFTTVNIPVASDRASATRYQRASDGLPTSAIDPVTGDVYIGWEDARGRSDNVNGIVFTKSSNGGLTWSPVTPIPVNDGPDLNHYNVMLGMGADSTLHLAYLQRQEGADRTGFLPTIDAYHQQSGNGGTTWTAPLKISSQPAEARYGAFSRNGLFQGDYNQLASGGAFTYIVRERAYAQYPGEPAGQVYNSSSDVYTGDVSGCRVVAGINLDAPGCLPHLHQRTWVSVLSANGAEGAPLASPTPSTDNGALPDTSTGVREGVPAAGVGLALVSVVLAGLVLVRRRAPGPPT